MALSENTYYIAEFKTHQLYKYAKVLQHVSGYKDVCELEPNAVIEFNFESFKDENLFYLYSPSGYVPTQFTQNYHNVYVPIQILIVCFTLNEINRDLANNYLINYLLNEVYV